MTPRRYFSSQSIDEDFVTLAGEEFRHIATVMRARVGDEMEVVDGRGKWVRAVIRKMDRHFLRADVIESKSETRPAVNVIIAPSLTKSHAMSWMIEKLSEMGVDEIWPIIAERTDAHASAALLEKWEKIASQSLKVNRRLWRTEIRPPISLGGLVVAAVGIPTKILLEIDGKSRLRPPVPFPAVVAIGPPGDFTAVEQNRFREGGFAGCQINNAVLKTETAALAAAAILKND